MLPVKWLLSYFAHNQTQAPCLPWWSFSADKAISEIVDRRSFSERENISFVVMFITKFNYDGT